MRRRDFIALLGGSAALMPVMGHAQHDKRIRRVGVLWHAASAEEEDVFLAVVEKEFASLGYVEGKNLELLHRFPAEQPERFAALAKELVDSNVDVIISATTKGASEVKRLRTDIPTVFVLAPDPVGSGLVESLARPGGNMTGLSLMVIDVNGKRLGLLKEAVPKLTRIALLSDRAEPTNLSAFSSAAAALGLSTRYIELGDKFDIEPAFATLAAEGIGGASLAGSLTFNERARVGAAALAHKIPTSCAVAEMVPYGMLMSYGPDFSDHFRKAVMLADKILKGAKPADLPVEQPTRFKNVISLKAARALGLTIPPAVLIAADEVIE